MNTDLVSLPVHPSHSYAHLWEPVPMATWGGMLVDDPWKLADPCLSDSPKGCPGPPRTLACAGLDDPVEAGEFGQGHVVNCRRCQATMLKCGVLDACEPARHVFFIIEDDVLRVVKPRLKVWKNSPEEPYVDQWARTRMLQEMAKKDPQILLEDQRTLWQHLWFVAWRGGQTGIQKWAKIRSGEVRDEPSGPVEGSPDSEDCLINAMHVESLAVDIVGWFPAEDVYSSLLQWVVSRNVAVFLAKIRQDEHPASPTQRWAADDLGVSQSTISRHAMDLRTAVKHQAVAKGYTEIDVRIIDALVAFRKYKFGGRS